jgi:uncharacterized membrane protein
MDSFLSILSSRYVGVLAINALIINRISALVPTPNRNHNYSLIVCILLRAPIIYLLSQALIDWTEIRSNYHYLFLLLCISYITHFFHTTLSRGNVRMSEFPSAYYDPTSPNLYEFAICFFFVGPYTVMILEEIVLLHFAHLLVLNCMGAVDKLYHYRLFPTVNFKF